MIPITERFLSDAGGWQALKQARALHDLGRVLTAAYAPPLLEGRVKEGDTEFRSGLKILSNSNVENLCTCRESRRNGTICAHALAIGLEIIKPRMKPESKERQTGNEAEMGLATEAGAPPNSNAAGVATAATSRFSTETGEPTQLFIIFPPNFIAAWEKDSITVVIEALAGGRRVLLSALDQSRDHRCTPAEARIVNRLAQLSEGALPGMITLTRAAFIALLPAFVGHERITLGKSVAVNVIADAIRPRLAVAPQEDGSLRLRMELPESSRALVAGSVAWLLQNATFSPLAPGLPTVYQDLLVKEVLVPVSHAAAFLLRELPTLHNAFEVILPEGFQAATIATPEAEEIKPRFKFALEGSLNHLTGKLDVWYGDRPFRIEGQGPSFSGNSPVRRNAAFETAALERLRQAGFSAPDSQGQMTLKGEPRILSFFARDLPRLEREWEVSIGARFSHVTKDIERIQPKLDIRSSGENWFDLQIELASSGGERFAASEIQRLLQSGQTSTRLKNRKIAVFDPGMLDEFQQALVDCDPQQRQPGLYRIARPHAAYLESLAAEQGAAVQSDSRWRAWTDTRKKIGDLPQVPLGSLESILRPYQKQGVNWLASLQENGLAGIIADEMGLGKTVQALAFLRSIRGKSLIVCPSSLVFNWEREAARFTPDLRTLAVHGSERRELFGLPMQEADLIITSYPLLRRDIELYRILEFTAAVLDEAQHIKNPDSQNAQAACALRARHRFLLTGTPIENSVRDLWSLMHFLIPGTCADARTFVSVMKRRFRTIPPGLPRVG